MRTPTSEFAPIIVVPREEVNSGDTTSVLEVLKSCLASVDAARGWFERLNISFDGYDEDRCEVFEISEVRDFVRRLDEAFPYWLFFLDKSGLGLQAITLCFLPPYLTAEAKKRVFPERLDQLLSKRWFPAMNQLCEAVGFTEQEIEDLTDRVGAYFVSGPANRD